jgi:hypothetical protein
MTLDTYIKKSDIDKIDLIKIDVETHEPEVLEGFEFFLQKFKPSILIEVLNDEIGSKIQKAVSNLGYLYFDIDENGGVKQVSSIKRSSYYNYLLCLPDVASDLNLIPKV